MFRNVVLGVDGRPTGRDAIALAIALAEPDARLTLAHVYGGVMTPGRSANLAFDAAARADSDALLEAERETAGIGAELISISATSVGRGLHALAEERAADLLVVGSTARGLAGRVLVGDDTCASLNGASCAVAVAPRGYVAGSGGFATIGVGYDFSDESHAALAAARELAARDGSKIRALYVVSLPAWGYMAPMPGNWGEIVEEDRKSAADRVSSLEGVDASAVYGLPGEELAAFGGGVDLLVVGSRNYGPVRRLVLGSTSNALARHARCPLLVLPRTATVAEHSGADRSDRAEAPIVTAS
jgi:nucleotide-binding universal stress UspA family protein